MYKLCTKRLSHQRIKLGQIFLNIYFYIYRYLFFNYAYWVIKFHI